MDGFLQDIFFGYRLDFFLLFYYFCCHWSIPSDLLFLSSSLKLGTSFVGASDGVKVRLYLTCNTS